MKVDRDLSWSRLEMGRGLAKMMVDELEKNRAFFFINVTRKNS